MINIQLDVLNSIFSTTPKPSKHARAKLALETGLSMRVIQVGGGGGQDNERHRSGSKTDGPRNGG